MKVIQAVRALLPAFVWLGVNLAAPGDVLAKPGVTLTVVPAATGNQLVGELDGYRDETVNSHFEATRK
jgi:hypothetical protein